MTVYRHPSHYRPALALGGHEWLLDPSPICVVCGGTAPRWAIREELWTLFVPRWCPAKIRALPKGTPPVLDDLERSIRETLGELPASMWLPHRRRADIARAAAIAAAHHYQEHP